MLRRCGFLSYLLLGLLSFGLCDAASTDLRHPLNATAVPLQQDGYGMTRLIDATSNARVVLLGEASHGTHEFYVWRSRLSRQLIEAGRVAFVAIEGDSATLAPLDRYVRHAPEAPVSARAALAGISHWPSWVWANAELADFAEWLHAFNGPKPYGERVAIHGLDLYAIAGALDAVEAYYRRHAPRFAARVRQLNDRFSPFRERPSAYADTVKATGQSLRPYATAIVNDLEHRYRRSSRQDRDRVFLALQLARAAAAGFGYLEALPEPPLVSSNLRSRHFGLTLHRLLAHYGDGARGIVWAHNTHVGDARATNGRFTGQVSLGQLARQTLGAHAVFILGFGTGGGEVLASTHWGGPCQILKIPVPRPDSLEAAMLVADGQDRFWLFSPGESTAQLLAQWLPHRAIGSTFDPAREALQNYVPTQPTGRYDAFVFLPFTRPLLALDWPSGSARCSRSHPD